MTRKQCKQQLELKDFIRPTGSREVKESIWFIACIAFSVMGLSSSVDAASPIVALKQDQSTPISNMEVKENKDGIFINIKNRSLRNVLQRIQNVSQVHFEVPTALMETPITATVAAPDWRTAIHKLLRNYNHINVIGDHKQLTRVIVVEGFQQGDIPLTRRDNTQVVEKPLPITHEMSNETSGSVNAAPSISPNASEPAFSDPPENQPGSASDKASVNQGNALLVDSTPPPSGEGPPESSDGASSQQEAAPPLDSTPPPSGERPPISDQTGEGPPASGQVGEGPPD